MRRLAAVVCLALVALTPAAQARQADDSVVHAVLFFSPTCGHCEYVIQEVLPPLFAERGGAWDVTFDESLADTGVPYYLLSNERLEVLLVDVTVPAGFALFAATTEALAIGNEAVPRLVVGNRVMIGSQDIPDRFPGMVDAGLAAEGIDWPALPGLEEAVDSLPAEVVFSAPADLAASENTAVTTTTTAVPTTAEQVEAAPLPLPIASDDSVADRFGRDPVGNTVAVIVLIGMLGALAWTVATTPRAAGTARLGWAIPLLAVLGLGVAGYLSYVEISAADAVCGPVGDCGAVQQSDYAHILGIPIGVVGLLGYAVMLGAWLFQRGHHTASADRARVGLAVLAVAGVAFSLYLTFLEPFVIGATCAWCLSSAIIVTGVMVLALPAGWAAWRRLRSGQQRLELEQVSA